MKKIIVITLIILLGFSCRTIELKPFPNNDVKSLETSSLIQHNGRTFPKMWLEDYQITDQNKGFKPIIQKDFDYIRLLFTKLKPQKLPTLMIYSNKYFLGKFISKSSQELRLSFWDNSIIDLDQLIYYKIPKSEQEHYTQFYEKYTKQ
jgi:hypothetical protein